MNAEQASKVLMQELTLRENGESGHRGTRRATPSHGPAGVVATACMYKEIQRNTGSLMRWPRDSQPDAREGEAGPYEVADRLVVVTKLL